MLAGGDGMQVQLQLMTVWESRQLQLFPAENRVKC